MQIKGLLFDKDGTLYDFQKTWGAWADGILRELFDTGRERAARQLGYDLQARRFLPSSPVIAETSDTVARLLLPELPDWTLERLAAHLRQAAAVAPLIEAAPLRPLLEALRDRGLKLGLATNDDEASARRHLATSGIDELIPFVAGYDSGWGGKPEAGQLRAFLDWAGLGPEAAAMVGDSRHDLAAGRAAGMHTVGVLSGPASAADLADLADVVLPDISGLPAWLDRPA